VTAGLSSNLADTMPRKSRIHAIDLFCGAGGLSVGLKSAGIRVVAGVDVDPSCDFPFTKNVKAKFIEQDVAQLTAERLRELWGSAETRMLAGCAPCQPFSPYRRGIDTSDEPEWPLLGEFGRLIAETLPELVTMENVPRVGSSQVFAEFVETLEGHDYHVDWRSCRAADFGLPQTRRRLVLVASLLGPVRVPTGHLTADEYVTVEDAIGDLPTLENGGVDPDDPLHRCRTLTEINVKRIEASEPGGTWKDWPKKLRAPCHKKSSGSTFKNVYARMEWDKPSPTITTLAYNYGTGRFGHPAQNRAISLREAAMLQGFPRDYAFVADDAPVRFIELGRLIGNAVPPPLGRAVGRSLVKHVTETTTQAA
jgi:DNA (cytosine-5)-methyltransferase 1